MFVFVQTTSSCKVCLLFHFRVCQLFHHINLHVYHINLHFRQHYHISLELIDAGSKYYIYVHVCAVSDSREIPSVCVEAMASQFVSESTLVSSQAGEAMTERDEVLCHAMHEDKPGQLEQIGDNNCDGVFQPQQWLFISTEAQKGNQQAKEMVEQMHRHAADLVKSIRGGAAKSVKNTKIKTKKTKDGAATKIIVAKPKAPGNLGPKTNKILNPSNHENLCFFQHVRIAILRR